MRIPRQLFGSLITSVFLFSLAPTLFGQTCPCDVDLVGTPICNGGDGLVGINDVTFELQCVTQQGVNSCSYPPEACDVNCDGVLDYRDLSAVLAKFVGSPIPCQVATGACCTDNATYPGCALSSSSICSGTLGGVYQGNGTTCDPSPCDCNDNGIPDETDITNQTSDDCNTNGTPDECELGGCCFTRSGTCSNNPTKACNSNPDCPGASCNPQPVQQICAMTRRDTCLNPPLSGSWRGACEICPAQTVGIVQEGDGSIFVHIIGPPVGCNGGNLSGNNVAGTCSGPPYTDAWVSSGGATMCHNFGSPETQPIPAGFFGSDSDAFTGNLCLEGVPLGMPQFGDADTLIERSADPFTRCAAPSATPETVPLEIVALNLVSVSPITVTYNGGQNPQQWDAEVDLAPGGPLPGTPASSLTATKTDLLGGTYTSLLYVQPRFTFTRVGSNPTEERVFDTFIENVDAIELAQATAKPWVVEVHPDLGYSGDPCSAFHPGIDSIEYAPVVDCNANAKFDDCDIESEFSYDTNHNMVPDECEGIFIPAVSQWGMLVLALLVLSAASIVLRRHRILMN